MAIAVQRKPLNKWLEYPFCMRTKVKIAVRSAPERNWATQRLDETDLYSLARDDAKRITATDIMEKQANSMLERATESRMGAMSAKCKGSKEKIPRESPYGREPTSTHSRLSQPGLSPSGEVCGEIKPHGAGRPVLH